MQPKTLILRAAGVNCEAETAHAFERAGASAHVVHVNQLIQNPKRLEDYQMLAIPGGFSYGDDISAGKILANQFVHHLRDNLLGFRDAGKPIIGICNGFQVLIKTDLLPGPVGDRHGQTATLTSNDSGRYHDRWIRLSARSMRCVWTKNLNDFDAPMAHGEGRFVPANDATRQALSDEDRIALVYVKPDGSPAAGEWPHNPNGSVDDIAGVCDATGLVLGMMPHPERFISPLQHPAWTSWKSLPDDGAGLAIFRNAVDHARDSVGAGV